LEGSSESSDSEHEGSVHEKILPSREFREALRSFFPFCGSRMVSFVCDTCQDTVTKPKIDNHKMRCRGANAFTCVDCGIMFLNGEWKSHTSCFTEAEKYQGALYKGPKKRRNQTNKIRQNTLQNRQRKNRKTIKNQLQKKKSPAPKTPAQSEAQPEAQTEEIPAAQEDKKRKIEASEDSNKKAKTNEPLGLFNQTKLENSVRWKKLFRQAFKEFEFKEVPLEQLRESMVEKIVADPKFLEKVKYELEFAFNEKVGHSKKITINGNNAAYKK